MQTPEEIEALLGKGADAFRELQKAAKDQAARQTSEPTDTPRTLAGNPTTANPPTIQQR